MKKVLNLLLAGALAAMSFSVVNGAVIVLDVNKPVTFDNSPDPVKMEIFLLDTQRSNEVEVLFSITEIGLDENDYVDALLLSVPAGFNENNTSVGGVTQRTGLFQSPEVRFRKNRMGDTGNPAKFDLEVRFAAGNKPRNVLFDEVRGGVDTTETVSFLITRHNAAEGTFTAETLSQELDSTGQFFAAASVVRQQPVGRVCEWYTTGNNPTIPEPSTALLGLISLVGLVRRKL